ncbi:hypothetical protein SDC9_135065 [bioreactor metagenome]|uniref:Uncharacterized protein n=1 Tax=bioreactor metagenome TaxID=1076179 RepID=A0A645DEU4_9ZZZZ
MEHGALHSVLAHYRESDQDVACLSDTGVCQHPLDVRLGYRHEVAHGHGHRRYDGECPLHALGKVCARQDEQHDEDLEQCHKPHLLGSRCQETGNGGGCSLVDIGGPHVEGHRSDLEAVTCYYGHKAYHDGHRES